MPQQPGKPYGRFDFDLAAGVTKQLIAAFEALSVGPLVQSMVEEIEAAHGVYQLYVGETLMYVGKADMPLPRRLEQHRWTLSGRQNLGDSSLGFKALIIHKNWAPSVHESILIKHYRDQGMCEWNLTGLGNHDPGHNREDTVTNEDHFDMMYPIREDFVPEGIDAKQWNAHQLLRRLKKALPFFLRYETDGNFHNGARDYNNLGVTVPRDGMTVKELLTLMVSALPVGWQATFFPGRVILYKERKDYVHATDTIRKT